VKRFWLSLLPALLGFCIVLAGAQTTGQGYPTPPPSMDPDTRKSNTPSSPARRVDLAQLQKEADELARIAQTIPADVASVKKGMLPKDVIEKLKQIERLSKRLRSELTP